MTIAEIETMAFHGTPLPDDVKSLADINAYHAFRNLYDYAKRVQMRPEQGKREKAQIVDAHRLNKFNEDMFEEDSKIWAKISGPVVEYTNEPSIEKADKILELLYGVKRKGGIRNEPM